MLQLIFRVVHSNREGAAHPGSSRQFFLGRGTSQYGGDGLPGSPTKWYRSGLIPTKDQVGRSASGRTGDFGFESMTLSQAYPEADTKWAVNSIEVCLSVSGHPACRRRRSNGQALSPRWVRQREKLLVGLPPRGRPHCGRPGTHGDKSERLEAPPASLPLTRASHREALRVSPWPSATIFRRISNSAAVVRLNKT